MAVRQHKSAVRKHAKPRIISTVLMALLCGIILFEMWFFCRIVWFTYQNPSSSAVMKEALSDMREKNLRAQLDYEWIPYDRISDSLKRAVVASEDSNFTEHDGVEWDAIRKAWEYNLAQAGQGSDKVRGGSTITQQLAKNLFLSGSRNYLRKGQELVLTFMIEHVMSKRRILELYLNIAEWGHGVFGAQAAARYYYKTSPARLDASQAATLAAMLPNPRYYDQHRDTAYLNRRSNTLQRRMQQVEVP